MSFSLNIFVPPEDEAPQTPSIPSAKNREDKKSENKKNTPQTDKKVVKKTSNSRLGSIEIVKSASSSSSDNNKSNQEASKNDFAKSFVEAKSEKTSKSSLDQPSSSSLSSNGKIESGTAKSLVSKDKRPEEQQAMDDNNKEESKSESVDKDDNESVDTKQYSRKNPAPRQRQRAPYSVIREVLRAPTEEKASEESSHIFANVATFGDLGLTNDLVAHVSGSTEEKGMGLTKPTTVQALSIPWLLKGRDCMIKSETGSGKTLTFVLPILHSLLTMPTGRIKREDGTYALLLSPTRELCLQIFDVLVAASKPFHWIISTAIVGGEKKKSEKARLRKGVNIIVATPGRFADHLRTTFSLQDSLGANPLRWLVLDEADRLLDTGFEKQVQEILDTLKNLSAPANESSDNGTSKPTQTVLLSATITSQVEKLAGLCLVNPLTLDGAKADADLKKLNQQKQQELEPDKEGEDATTPKEARIIEVNTDDAYVTPKQLVQHYMLVESGDRLVALAAYIRRHVRRTGNTCKTLVFVASRACAEFFHAILSQIVWPPVEEGQEDSKPRNNKKHSSKSPSKQIENNTDTTAPTTDGATGASSPSTAGEGLGTKWYVLHGSVDQKERRKTVKEFAGARGGVLICTDVAARGLDLPQVDLVIQYDPPSETSEYVHRIGRTARSGRRGQAVIFLREAEILYLEVLKKKGIEPSPVKMSYDSLLLPPLVDEKTGKRIKNENAGELSTDPEACKLRLQKDFEDLVNRDQKLQELARNGYLSWVGAYAVHSSETKSIFVTRELHFGHVARSFALREPPTKIKQRHDDAVSSQNKKNKRGKDDGDGGSAKKKPRRDGEGGGGGSQKKMKRAFDFKSEFEA